MRGKDGSSKPSVAVDALTAFFVASPPGPPREGMEPLALPPDSDVQRSGKVMGQKRLAFHEDETATEGGQQPFSTEANTAADSRTIIGRSNVKLMEQPREAGSSTVPKSFRSGSSTTEAHIYNSVESEVVLRYPADVKVEFANQSSKERGGQQRSQNSQASRERAYFAVEATICTCVHRPGVVGAGGYQTGQHQRLGPGRPSTEKEKPVQVVRRLCDFEWLVAELSRYTEI